MPEKNGRDEGAAFCAAGIQPIRQQGQGRIADVMVINWGGLWVKASMAQSISGYLALFL